MPEFEFDRKRMREIRLAKKLTLAEVARRGGVPNLRMVSDIELGRKRDITADTLARLCKGLGIRSKVPLMTNRTRESEPQGVSEETPLPKSE